MEPKKKASTVLLNAITLNGMPANKTGHAIQNVSRCRSPNDNNSLKSGVGSRTKLASLNSVTGRSCVATRAQGASEVSQSFRGQ